MKSLRYCVLMGAFATSAALAQSETPVLVAEVTGNNVYVRSGPSTNYYPVTRLNRDDRVVVFESTLGWASITPPEGTFSLIHKEFIDPDGPTAGVVNGDRVWVYAGSMLSKQRYAKQLKLNKGEAVRIIGQLDQYYKIEPPTGARLWITEDYLRKTDAPAPLARVEVPVVRQRQVDHASQAAPKTLSQAEAMLDFEAPVLSTVDVPAVREIEPPVRSDIETAGIIAPTPQGSDSDTLVLQAVPVDAGSTPSAVTETIDRVEADLAFEFAKEPLQRNLQSYIQRFRVIARDGQGATAREYATHRIAQLERATQHLDALRQMHALREQMEQDRQRFSQERANIVPAPAVAVSDFVARGRLVASAAYRNPTGPQRFRLVNPDQRSSVPATVAYVEIDPRSGIDPQQYLGRYVGVRASGQKYLEGTVNPVVVYMVAELVVLDEPQPNTLSAATR